MLEFALGFGLVLTIFAGAWQFGYTFYVYNTLESAIRNGARYGALAAYDGGSWNGAGYKARVQNLVVYGQPNPSSGATPVIPGLTTDHVAVIPRLDSAGVPTRVTVEVSSFAIPSGLNNIFAGFTLTRKPSCTFEYNGRYMAP